MLALVRADQLLNVIEAQQDGFALLQGVEIVSDREARTPDPARAERIYYACLAEGLSFKISAGNVLTVGGLNVVAATFEGTPLVSTGGAITAFDDVTFQSMDLAGTQLTVNHPGAATPFTFDGLRFLTAPEGGSYLSATDTDQADGATLTVQEMRTPASSDSPPKVSASAPRSSSAPSVTRLAPTFRNS